ncbi:TRAP transporter small permease subunit [Variovorax sp. RT4R15]|uniref:TRAP transporter small permease subunit n=1 Tax=Variovorax sp. RT4R15 TaxID=3443737 RepID=UPI003F471020
MNVQRFLHAVDRFSMVVGKTFAWLIVVLMLVVCGEVFKRYALNAPTAWIFDANNMLYGTLFMMGGAYTLAQAGHVRGDFFYGRMKPRTQAALDLALFALFFLPGVVALSWSGWTYFNESLAMREQTFNADPLPLYPFKFVIPVAGLVLLIQGVAEMVRCVLCLKTGAWSPRLRDAQEMDVVGDQLAGSSYVDEADKLEVIGKAKDIEQAAQQRNAGVSQ